MTLLGVEMTFLCLMDESGRQVSPNRWFVYGGLAVEGSQIHELHRDLWRIRRQAHFSRDVALKWQAPPRKGRGSVKKGAHLLAVDAVLDACVDRHAKLLLVMTPAGVTVNTQANNDSIKIGMSYILGALQRFFLAKNEYGIVLTDNPPGSGKLGPVEDVLLAGVPRGVGGSLRRRYYDRLICTGVTSIRSSRLISAIDIPLGAFAFCLNFGGVHPVRARALYNRLRPILHRERPGRYQNPWGYGLRVRPQRFKERAYFNFANSGIDMLVSLGEYPPAAYHRPVLARAVF